MKRVLKKEIIPFEKDIKLVEYEKKYKSGFEKWYNIDDINEMFDKRIAKYV